MQAFRDLREIRSIAILMMLLAANILLSFMLGIASPSVASFVHQVGILNIISVLVTPAFALFIGHDDSLIHHLAMLFMTLPLRILLKYIMVPSYYGLLNLWVEHSDAAGAYFQDIIEYPSVTLAVVCLIFALLVILPLLNRTVQRDEAKLQLYGRPKFQARMGWDKK